ncbi:PstS family phosphate ABC transporter substrate-binding protein [Roseomonas sp. BN140053]|uniref:PstS family phosphate ABC transporter substrate-binding protein n=1 Tax=Roseomonas sp. BN140053 TaxID=3391898 RepID=UPI0039E7A4A1
MESALLPRETLPRRAMLALPWLGMPPARAAAAPLRVNGGGSALATMRRIGAGFARTEGGVALEIGPSLGGVGGLDALLDGRLDAVLSARPLNTWHGARGLTAMTYARSALVFATHPGVAAEGVTQEEAGRILAGTLRFWPDGSPIRVVRRSAKDMDTVLLRTQLPTLGPALAALAERPGLLTAGNAEENADTLEQLPGSFGILPLGQIAAEGRRLRPLALDGVAPGLTSSNTGRYPAVKTFQLVLRADAPPAALLLRDYLAGPETHALLESLSQGSPWV